MAHHRLASAVHDKVAAVAPTIEGVSLGSQTDKTKWTIMFKSGTHASTKAAAQEVIDDFDIAAEEAILEAIEPSLI